MAYLYGNHQLTWKGDALRRHDSRKPILRIVPDQKYPSMWRVECPDGRLSDMLNRTRAQDAARAVALRTLNEPRLEAAE